MENRYTEEVVRTLLDVLSVRLYHNFILVDLKRDRFIYMSQELLQFYDIYGEDIFSKSAKQVFCDNMFNDEYQRFDALIDLITNLLSCRKDISMADISISLDKSLVDKSGKVCLVNNKYVPLKLSVDGSRVVLLLIIVSLPTSECALEKIIVTDHKNKNIYSLSSGKFWKFDENQILSSTELKVLKLFALGKSRKQIALQLERSEETIKSISSSIRRKLDSRNITEAVLKATYFRIL